MRDLLGTTMGGAVRIETVLKGGLWKALVDPTQIELIILNLAINARDAMEVGGNLTVETSNVTLNRMPNRPEEPAPGEYVMLSVTDTGTGMTEQVLAKAFEPFFTTKDVGKGSGLGLAQVYGFAKQSGGGVRIESRLGEGSTVKVYLPRASAAEKDDQGRSHETRRTGDEGQHLVLLVDDDSAVREITAAMLHDLGFHVLEAGSGGAALDVLAREPKIDLLLLDYAMPGMTGAEVAEEVRPHRPDLPILFITGYADLAALKEVGEDHVVQKPFREAELAEKISRAMAVARPGNVVELRARGG
jgi:CheY-like chemotaxis protein